MAIDAMKMADDIRKEDVYRSYQERTRISEVLQHEIMNGAREGEDPCLLLLKATRAISLMTGNDTFADQIERLLKGVYGEALGYKAPLEVEISQLTDRLRSIETAMTQCEDPDLKNVMDYAIRSHKRRIEHLSKINQVHTQNEQKKAVDGWAVNQSDEQGAS